MIRSPYTTIEAWHDSKEKIQILLVISSPIGEPHRIDAQKEIKEIVNQLSSSKVSAALIIQSPPTFEDLNITLSQNRSFEIIHFIGHARPDAIQLEHRNGTSNWVSIEAFKSLFKDVKANLIILNNCSSENLGRELQFDGVPAVITSSNRIKSDTSHSVAGTLYSRLLDGSTPREAIAAVNRVIEGKTKSKPETEITAIGPSVHDRILNPVNDEDGPVFYPCEPIYSPKFKPKKSTIFGREKEQENLFNLLTTRNSPFIAITGFGGFGKSTLALAATWHYKWYFRGGMAYVSLREMGPFNLTTIFKDFNWGLENYGLEEQEYIVRKKLSESPFLLLIDDIEKADISHIQGIKRLLASWDTAMMGGRAILIMRPNPTIQKELEDLIDPGNWITIKELTKQASLELFNSVIGGEEKARSIVGDKLKDIPRLCFQHPILIEYAAASLQMGIPWNDVSDNLERLPKNGTRLARMVKIMDGIIIHIEKEAPAAVPFLDAWIAFKDMATEDAWSYVATGKYQQDITDDISAKYKHVFATMQNSLILDRTEEDGRIICRIHPLISLYLRRHRWNKLTTDMQVEYQNRHLSYYKEKINSDQTNNYPIAEDWGNITLAFKQVQEMNNLEKIVKFAKVLVGNTQCQIIDKGPWDYAEWVLNIAIESAKAIKDIRSLSEFYLIKGVVKYRIAEFKEAEHEYRESYLISKDNEYKDLEVDALKGLGQIFYRKGNLNYAKIKFDSALKLAKSINDETNTAKIYHQLGKVALREEKYEKAEELFKEVLKHRESMKEESGIAKSLHELGRVNHQKSPPNYKKADRLYKESLKLRENLNDLVGQQATYYQLGELAIDQHNFQEAENYNLKCEKLSTQLNDRFWQVYYLFQKARILWELKEDEKSLENVLRAKNISEELKISLRKDITNWTRDIVSQEWQRIKLIFEIKRKSEKWEEIISIGDLFVGEAENPIIEKGLGENANWILEISIFSAKKTKRADWICKFLLSLGEIKYRLEEYTDAKEAYKEVLLIANQGTYFDLQIDALRGIGQIDYRLGEKSLAKNNYEQALELAKEISDERRIARLQHQLGKIAFKEADFALAGELFSESLKFRQRERDKLGEAKTLHEIARVQHNQTPADYKKAKQLYLESLRLRQEVGDLVGQQATNYQLGELELDQKNIEAAEKYNQIGEELANELDNSFWIAHFLYQKARISWARKDYDAAIELGKEAQELSEKKGIGFRKDISHWVKNSSQILEKQKKAKKYADEPNRFKINSIEIDMTSDHDVRKVQYKNDKWLCSCNFFKEKEICSHIMAIRMILEDKAEVRFD